MKTAGILLVVLTGILPDSSGHLRREPREWKDDAGRVVKRVDTSGRVFLFTWDVSGRLVRASGLAARVNPGASDGAVPEGGEAWVHYFFYRPEGLVGEVDCLGKRHEFLEARTLDPKAGTALTGHRHVEETGARRPLSLSPSTQPPLRFEFDLAGRAAEVTPR